MKYKCPYDKALWYTVFYKKHAEWVGNILALCV